jgi:hypothetical protein
MKYLFYCIFFSIIIVIFAYINSMPKEPFIEHIQVDSNNSKKRTFKK